VREYSVPAAFTVGEHDNIVNSVFDHERDDPDHVTFQRLVDGAWADVTASQAADQIRSAALGLIALGVKPGDRVAVFSATRYEWPILDFAILAVGALAGLLLSIITSLMSGFFRGVYLRPEALEVDTGLAVLAVVPDQKSLASPVVLVTPR